MEHYTLPHRHNQSMSQLMSHLPNIEEFQTTADIFKQLSDPTRIRIFWILCHCEECVINIASMMEMSSPAVAHHLRLLRSIWSFPSSPSSFSTSSSTGSPCVSQPAFLGTILPFIVR